MTKQTSIKEKVEKKTINNSNNKLYLFENKVSSSLRQNLLAEKAQIEQDKKGWQNAVSKNLGDDHLYDLTVVDGLQQKFGLVNAILNKYADFIIGPGLYIKSKDENGQKILSKWISRTNFNRCLYPFVMDALSKGFGTLELTGINDKTKETSANNVSCNTMYKVRDKYGKTIRYNQYIGKSNTSIDIKDIIGFMPEEIIQFDVNKTGSNAYGWGIVYPALQIIDDFLLAQKSIHKLTKRKANTPIHARIGNAEKDDYPEQSDIDSFGDKLVYLDESTEWVTGPNVEFKVIDFGNIGDKFTTLLENDYKLLSYAFQVPEVLMGAGNIAEGLANVQMDAFERRVKLLQEELGSILKEKVFRKILSKQGLEIEFDVEWGQPSEDDKIKKIQLLLQVGNTSPGMRSQCEQEIAEILGYDYAKVEVENKIAQQRQDAIMAGEKPTTQNIEKEVQKKDMEKEEEIKLPIMPGQLSNEKITEKVHSNKVTENKYLKGVYRKESCCSMHSKEESRDYSIQEWTNLNVTDYTKQIIAVILADKFSDLKADNTVERAAGYMSEKDIAKLKVILASGFEEKLSIKEIENKLKSSGIVKNLYAYNDKGLELDKDDKKQLIVDKETRAHMIARTEVNRVANEGAIQSYKDVGIQEVRWISASDDRQCDICSELNGKIYNINESIELPPKHIMCRCSTIPIVRGLTNG